jgi:hypothetical protein
MISGDGSRTTAPASEHGPQSTDINSSEEHLRTSQPSSHALLNQRYISASSSSLKTGRDATGVSGTGSVLTNGEERRVSAGKLVLVRKGARRSTLALSEGFSYLTVHLRRSPLQIGREAR